MFLARIVFFRLHESPRYLVHAGRPQEAVESLQMISKFNGSDLEIELGDVVDHHPPEPPSSSSPTAAVNTPKRSKVNETTVFDAGDVDGTGTGGSSPTKSSSSSESSGSSRAPLVTQYDSIGQTPATVLEGHSFTPSIRDSYPPSPKLSRAPSSTAATTSKVHDEEDKGILTPRSASPVRPHILDSQSPHLRRHTSIGGIDSRRTSRRLSTISRRSSVYEYERKCRALPRWVRKPLAVWWDRVSMVLEPEWFRTTILVWAVWFSMSLGESLIIDF